MNETCPNPVFDGRQGKAGASEAKRSLDVLVMGHNHFDTMWRRCFLADATILGDVYPRGVVHGGKECRIPSQNGDLNQYPPVHVAGPSLRLDPRPAPPAPDEGRVGDIAWVDQPGREAIWIKTSAGWMRAELTRVLSKGL